MLSSSTWKSIGVGRVVCVRDPGAGGWKYLSRSIMNNISRRSFSSITTCAKLDVRYGYLAAVDNCGSGGNNNNFLHRHHKAITVNRVIIRTKMDYTQFFNEKSKKRTPSLIRELTKMMHASVNKPLFFAGGFPNPEMFPFESISVRCDANTEFKIEGNDIRSALQYQPTLGYAPLIAELKTLVQRVHKPPKWDDTDGMVTVGSQHGLSGILELILNQGDPIVVPEPLYSSVLSIIDPYDPHYLVVPEDSSGMKPSHLKSILDKWQGQEKQPKVLYVNPTGTNPSGVIVPTERKREIYQIAREYNLLILEDDPYYWLHYEKEDPTSFLSLDVDGRVIRLDSFSKVFSSGIRVGFATGPKEIIRHLELSTQHSVLHCSSLSQVVVHRILEQWGPQGFTQHTDKVKEFYRKRRDLMVTAAEKHLKGLAEWHVPRGGMFLWMKVHGLTDSFEMLMQRGLEQGVMFLPGREFMCDKRKPCPYVRASFSVAPLEDFDKGMERLASLIKNELELQKAK